MTRRILLFAILALFITSSAAFADEGMWPYNLVPKAKIKAKYGFEPTQEWLDHLRLASIRTGGGSASFVSPDGLVFTNHHVGAGCVHNLSTEKNDYIKDGFYAPTRAQEPKCPGIEFTSLLDIKDITKEVHEAARPGMSDAEAGAAQRALLSKLEKECSDPAKNVKCDTITLYSGGMYHLYKYKKYTDVRLVMAPEFDIAFFGGDPDNFTYPRYDLDITFFRIYENDEPLKVEHYLPFTTTPVKEGDLVFVSGHPGTTGRLQTVAQLEYLRDVAYPFRLKVLERSIALLKEFGTKSEENARVAERALFGAQNSYKATKGYQSGLLDKDLMAKKAADEKALRDAVMADPKLREQYAGAWDAVANAVNYQRKIFTRNVYGGDTGMPGRLATMARALVRVAEERTKPNEKRLRQYQDQALPTLKQNVFSTAPISNELEMLQLATTFEDMVAALGNEDEFVQAVLEGKTPPERAKELVAGSKLSDLAVRKELFEGGMPAIEASTDPMIAFMRKIDPLCRKFRKDMEDNVDAVIRKNGTLIAKARFAKYGTDLAPDATSSLRLSYGAVKGYVDNGKKIPYHTTIGDAFAYAEKHGNKPPYKLPDSWMKAKSILKLNTPFDSVNTSDIIGGNSGSPTVNRKGEVVGIIFDGNIQSLPMNFLYEDKVGRAVITDSAVVIESLRKIYKAEPLADELLGSKSAKKAPATKPAQKNAALPATN